MTAPYRHISAAELMGSWPVVPHPEDGYAKPYLLTGTVMESAKILGMRRSPAGYDVHNKSLAIYVDGVFKQIDFDDYGPGLYSLDQVVSNINGDVGATVAYADNGFLLLKSATAGQGSSLRPESVASYESLLSELGLLAGVEALAGDLEPATHLDPTRQVATPGQLAPMWGEPMTADHFNRVAMQLAFTSDDSHNLFYKKRTAQKKVYETTLAGVPSFQLATADLAYMGPDATPTVAQLEEVIAVLDENDDEIVVEAENITHSVTATVTFLLEPDTDSQLVTFNGVSPFQSTDPEGDWYVRVGVIGGPLSALDGVLMKILEYRSSNTVVVHPVVPGTGQVLKGSTTTGSTTQERVQVITAAVRVEGFYSDAGLTQRAEQVNQPRQGPLAVTRIERNNRIVCDTGTFVASGVIAGDLVSWDGAGASTPYSNQGSYRVSQVIDAHTLELVAGDFGSAVLNAVGPVHGNVTITSDGDFLSQPYVKFEDAAVVPNGNVRIVYLGSSTLKDATDDVAMFAGSVRHAQEAEARLQKAVIGLAGPSMDSLSDVLNWVYGDRRNNLENTITRLIKEHHDDDTGGGGGRHSDIRPDTIDMFPETAGETVTFRAATGEDYTDAKVVGRDAAGNPVFQIAADGTVSIGESAPLFSSADLYIYRLIGTATQRIHAVTGQASLRIMGDSGDAELQLEAAGGSSNDAVIELSTDSMDPWIIIADESELQLEIENDDHANIMTISWEGEVAFGDDVETGKQLTVHGRGSADEDLLYLKGSGDTNAAVRSQYHPRSATGAIVGTIEALNDGVGYEEFYVKSSEDLYLQAVTGALFIEADVGIDFAPVGLGSVVWRMSSADGSLIPSTLVNIGDPGDEVDNYYGYRAFIGKGAYDSPLSLRPRNVDEGINYMTWSYEAAAYNGGVEIAVLKMGILGKSGSTPLNYILSNEALTLRTDFDDKHIYVAAAATLDLRGGNRAGSTQVDKKINFRTDGVIRWTIDDSGNLIPNGAMNIGSGSNKINNLSMSGSFWTSGNLNVGGYVQLWDDGFDERVAIDGATPGKIRLRWDDFGIGGVGKFWEAAERNFSYVEDGTTELVLGRHPTEALWGMYPYTNAEGYVGTPTKRLRDVHTEDVYAHGLDQIASSDLEAVKRNAQNQILARATITWSGSAYAILGDHWNVTSLNHTATGRLIITLDRAADNDCTVVACYRGDPGDGDNTIYGFVSGGTIVIGMRITGNWADHSFNFIVVGPPATMP